LSKSDKDKNSADDQRWKAERLLIGRIVRDARNDAGLTQEDLAEALGWNRDNSVVSGIERGKRSLQFIEFMEIAKIVGRDPNDLVKEYQKRLE